MSDIVFADTASSYTITVNPGLMLNIGGTGVTNNSGVTQTFVSTGGQEGQSADIEFNGNASAGGSTNEYLVLGDSDGSIPAGLLTFNDNSTAGQAIISSGSGFGWGGETLFDGNSAAGDSTIINQNTDGAQTGPGNTYFVANSSAGNAHITCLGGSSGGFGGEVWFLSAASTAGGSTIVVEGGQGFQSYGGELWFYPGSAGNATITI